MAVDFSGLSNFIAAAGALGTAAYGLVDASKAFRGGVSNAGFRSIRDIVNRLLGDTRSPGTYGTADVLATLRADWLNGVAKADQKATAKSLIRLALTPGNAPALASAVGVDTNELTEVAGKIRDGVALTQQDLGVLGRFDAIVSALLDEAYELADQQYRNWSKLFAAVVAIGLAAVAGGVIYAKGRSAFDAGYFQSQDLLTAILIGAISTPLAPIAKDVSSALAAAVSAVSAWKR